jgi:hypothetical protein
MILYGLCLLSVFSLQLLIPRGTWFWVLRKDVLDEVSGPRVPNLSSCLLIYGGLSTGARQFLTEADPKLSPPAVLHFTLQPGSTGK